MAHTFTFTSHLTTITTHKPFLYPLNLTLNPSTKKKKKKHLPNMASKYPEPSPWHFTNEFNYTFQIHGQTTILVVIFFSFILLIIFLYTYFHFLTRYGHFSAHADTTAASLSHSRARPIGLDAATINSLPIFMHLSSLENPNMDNFEVKESECSICLGLFEDREIVKVLPTCKHAYHSECVDKWLSTQSSCPLCRASLQVNSQGELASRLGA